MSDLRCAERLTTGNLKNLVTDPLKRFHSFICTCTVCMGEELQGANLIVAQMKCDYLARRHPSAGKVSHLWGNEVKVMEVHGLKIIVIQIYKIR